MIEYERIRHINESPCYQCTQKKACSKMMNKIIELTEYKKIVFENKKKTYRSCFIYNICVMKERIMSKKLCKNYLSSACKKCNRALMPSWIICQYEIQEMVDLLDALIHTTLTEEQQTIIDEYGYENYNRKETYK